MKKTTENRLVYGCLAVIFIPMSIYINYDEILNGEFPNAIMLLFLGIAAAMMSYVSPYIYEKSERTRYIVRKSVTANYFILFVAFLTLFTLTSSLSPFTLLLNVTEVLVILCCTMMTTIPLTLIIYTKKTN